MKKIPIRSMIVAPKGHLLLEFDLQQAESWVVAYLAREPNMKHSLAHGDIHFDTACVIFNISPQALLEIKVTNPTQFASMRYVGKQQNHAKAYREGYRRAAEIINRQSDRPPFVTVTFGESKLYDERWHSHYNVKRWWSEIEEQLNKNRTLVTPYGRIRTFYDAWGEDLFKKATAHNPQSTVADHFNGAIQSINPVKGGLREIYKRFVIERKVIRITNQAHDSCVVEAEAQAAPQLAHEISALVRRPLIINGESFVIPVECKIGERWGELEKFTVAA